MFLYSNTGVSKIYVKKGSALGEERKTRKNEENEKE
jgi:hypothetical protein